MERPNFTCDHTGLKEGAHIIHHSLCNGDPAENKPETIVIPTVANSLPPAITEIAVKPRDPVGTGT